MRHDFPGHCVGLGDHRIKILITMETQYRHILAQEHPQCCKGSNESQNAAGIMSIIEG
jgi:hypothetical protein